MNLESFKYLHINPTNAPVLGSDGTLFNLLYNLYDSINRLDAISVRITEENIKQLQQATALTFRVPGAGTYTTIRLDRINIPIDRDVVGSYYFFSIAPNIGDEYLRPEINPAPTPDITEYESYNTDLIIEPARTELPFLTGEYNALYGSKTVDRTSNILVKSDRGENKIHPGNLESILTGHPEPAPVQDSNYTLTGWINARYRGTSTSATEYGGVPPTIAGNSFTGVLYSINTSDTVIKTAPTETRTVKNYLNISGKDSKIGVPSLSLPPKVTPEFKSFEEYSSTATEVVLIPFTGETFPRNSRVEVGDFLHIVTQGTTVPKEIVKVVAVNHQFAQELVTVLRGEMHTSKATIIFTDRISIVENTSRVFELERNRVRFIEEGKLWIQVSGDILLLDREGYSATGSLSS